MGTTMKKIVLALSTIATLSTSLFAGGDIALVPPAVIEIPAGDNSSFYAGAGLSALSVRDAAVSMNIFSAKDGQERLGNITFLAGYNYNKYIALEGRYTTSITSEDRLKMSGWGLFVKPQYPITTDISIYGLLGFGGAKLKQVNNSGVNVSGSGLQWGVGASYNITQNIALFADYTSLANNKKGHYWNRPGLIKVDADAFTLGLTRKF